MNKEIIMGMIKQATIEAMSDAERFELIRWEYESGKNPNLDLFADFLTTDYPMEFEERNGKKTMEFLYVPFDTCFALTVGVIKNGRSIYELKKLHNKNNDIITEIY
jgi:hypothetical protein